MSQTNALQKLGVAQLVKKSPAIYETEGTWSCSYELATWSCPESDESNRNNYALFL